MDAHGSSKRPGYIARCWAALAWGCNMKWDLRRWMPWVTLVIDVFLINVAFSIAYWLRYNLQLFRSVDPANNVPYSVYLPMVILLTIVLVLANRREGPYDVRRGHPLFEDLYGLVNATTTAIMLLVVLVFFYRRLFYSRVIFVYAGLLILLLLGLARIVRWFVLARLRQFGQGVDHVLIIGAGEVGRTVMRNLIAQPDLGYRVVGFLDDDPSKAKADIGPIKAMGNLDNLPRRSRTTASTRSSSPCRGSITARPSAWSAEAERAGVRAGWCQICSSLAWAGWTSRRSTASR